MRLTLLGTGNPTPSLSRASAGYMVKVADDVIILDHGSGAHTRMLQAGVMPTDVTHVMFSHLHYDHCVDFPRLLLTHWDHGAGKIPDLKVFGPKGTAEHVDRLIGPNGAYRPDIAARCEWESSLHVYRQRGGTDPRRPPSPEVTEYAMGDAIETDNWKVSVVEGPHAQPCLSCVAIRIDSDQGSIVYSGDTGPSKALERLAKGCDILIHMCTSVSGTVKIGGVDHDQGAASHMDAARTAIGAGAKTLVCSHVYNQFDRPGIRERVIADIAGVYDGVLVLGEDLMELGLQPEQLGRYE